MVCAHSVPYRGLGRAAVVGSIVSVNPAFAEGKIIDAEHLGRGMGGRRGAAENPQDRVATRGPYPISLRTATPTEVNPRPMHQGEALRERLVVPSFNDASPRSLRLRVANHVDGIRDAVAHP